MSDTKHTQGKWVSGYGDGVTGPKTPSIDGPTVEDSLARMEWQKAGAVGNPPPPFFTVVSCGRETVAIVPGEPAERKANADLMSASPDMRDALDGLLRRYVELVECGDCGSWDPETEDEVIVARAAIAKAGGR